MDTITRKNFLNRYIGPVLCKYYHLSVFVSFARKSGVPNYFETSSTSSISRTATGRRIIYKRIPVYDAATSDLLSHADTVVGFISSALHHGSVLVHCKQGISRSATCVIFFLMRKAGMSLEKALALCRARRPDVEPIPAFMAQLKTYEDKCRRLGVIRDDNKEPKPVVGDEGNDKKRKGPVGPAIGPPAMIGPMIGPSREGSKGDEDKRVRSKKMRVIGPAVGPQMPSSSKGDTSDGDVAIRPSIGPMIKPGIQGREVDKDEGNSKLMSESKISSPEFSSHRDADKSSVIGPVIGSSMPMPRGNEEGGTRSLEMDMGPAIGPIIPATGTTPTDRDSVNVPDMERIKSDDDESKGKMKLERAIGPAVGPQMPVPMKEPMG